MLGIVVFFLLLHIVACVCLHIHYQAIKIQFHIDLGDFLVCLLWPMSSSLNY